MQENEALSAKIEAMRSQPSPLAAAKAKQEEHNSDQEKFKKLIENLQVGSPWPLTTPRDPSLLQLINQSFHKKAIDA